MKLTEVEIDIVRAQKPITTQINAIGHFCFVWSTQYGQMSHFIQTEKVKTIA